MPSAWRNPLLAVAAFGIEAAWLCPLVLLATAALNDGRPRPDAPAALLLVALAAFGLRALLSLDPDLGVARAVTVVAAVLSTLAVTWYAQYEAAYGPLDLRWLGTLLATAADLFRPHPGLLATLVGCALLWWRGVALATAPLDFEDLGGRFRVGLAALLVLHVVRLLAGSARAVAAGTDGLGLAVMAFFFCSLTALALGRLQEVDRPDVDGERLRTNRQWLGLLLAAVLGELLLAGVAAALFSGDLMGVITTPLGWLSDGLGRLVVGVLLLVGYGVEWLIYGVQWLLSALGIAPSLQLPEMPAPPNFDEAQEEAAQSAGLPPELVAGMKVAVVALVVGLALLLLARALFRQRADRNPAEDEERESVWSWDEARGDLRGLMNRLFGRLRGSGTALADLAGAAARHDDLTTVRGVYRALLRTAEREGAPRRPEQTPREFGETLAHWFATAREDVTLITDAYQRVRYGRDGAQGQVAGPVADAWLRAREHLKRPQTTTSGEEQR